MPFVLALLITGAGLCTFSYCLTYERLNDGKCWLLAGHVALLIAMFSAPLVSHYASDAQIRSFSWQFSRNVFLIACYGVGYFLGYYSRKRKWYRQFLVLNILLCLFLLPYVIHYGG
jgi:FtsH-binding integral membrane protein